ncbi:MAG: hypothetical protein ACOYK8_05885 [Alphaproteobacteria bacterium]
MTIPATNNFTTPAAQIQGKKADIIAANNPVQGKNDPAKDEGFSFWDLLDVVNPLQHIPIVNEIYRSITGDTIKPAAEMAGGLVFGGIVGAAMAAVNVAVEQETGQSISGNVIAALSPDDKPSNISENTNALATTNPTIDAPSTQSKVSVVAAPALPPTITPPALPAPALATTMAKTATNTQAQQPTEFFQKMQKRVINPAIPPSPLMATMLHSDDHKPNNQAILPPTTASSQEKSSPQPSEHPEQQLGQHEAMATPQPATNAGSSALPPALIADMMSLNYEKYAALLKNKQNAAPTD